MAKRKKTNFSRAQLWAFISRLQLFFKKCPNIPIDSSWRGESNKLGLKKTFLVSLYRIIAFYYFFCITDLLGYFVSCLVSKPDMAIIVSVPLLMPLIIFGGLLIKNGSAPDYLDWIRYLSWFMYANEALSINQWHGVTFDNPKCDRFDRNLTGINVPPDLGLEHPGILEIIKELLASISDFRDSLRDAIFCTGDDVLERFNFNPVSRKIFIIFLE